MVLLQLVDSFVGYCAPHFEQYFAFARQDFAPQLLQNTAASEELRGAITQSWSSGSSHFSCLLPFCFALPFSFFICVLLFCLCSAFLFAFCFFVCVLLFSLRFAFLFAFCIFLCVLLFCLRGAFLFAFCFFICVVLFLLAFSFFLW